MKARTAEEIEAGRARSRAWHLRQRQLVVDELAALRTEIEAARARIADLELKLGRVRSRRARRSRRDRAQQPDIATRARPDDDRNGRPDGVDGQVQLELIRTEQPDAASGLTRDNNNNRPPKRLSGPDVVVVPGGVGGPAASDDAIWSSKAVRDLLDHRHLDVHAERPLFEATRLEQTPPWPYTLASVLHWLARSTLQGSADGPRRRERRLSDTRGLETNDDDAALLRRASERNGVGAH